MPSISAAASRPAPVPPLAEPAETGALGVFQLKRLWSRKLAAMQGCAQPASLHDDHLDYLVTHAAGLGLEQIAEYFIRLPSFEEFERWIVATTGGIDRLRVARINAAVSGRRQSGRDRALARRHRSE